MSSGHARRRRSTPAPARCAPAPTTIAARRPDGEAAARHTISSSTSSTTIHTAPRTRPASRGPRSAIPSIGRARPTDASGHADFVRFGESEYVRAGRDADQRRRRRDHRGLLYVQVTGCTRDPFNNSAKDRASPAPPRCRPDRGNRGSCRPAARSPRCGSSPRRRRDAPSSLVVRRTSMAKAKCAGPSA